MEVDGRVRLFLYETLVATGRVPGNDRIAEALALDVADVQASLLRLEAIHALALAPGSRNPWMVHPFSAVPTGLRVEANGTTYWPNCAWDALAIPSLVGGSATAHGACADCRAPLEFDFQDGALRAGQALVHFVVPPRRFWENVGFT